jgi:hypothetical protein
MGFPETETEKDRLPPKEYLWPERPDPAREGRELRPIFAGIFTPDVTDVTDVTHAKKRSGRYETAET